jgi:hypothetical protein
MSIRRCTHRVGSSSCQHCEPAEQPPEVPAPDEWAEITGSDMCCDANCCPFCGFVGDQSAHTIMLCVSHLRPRLVEYAQLGAHLIDGEFQSDKYPTTPRGKVPLSVKDVTAQDLLWEYAQRRRSVDAEFSDDLEEALRAAGYVHKKTNP